MRLMQFAFLVSILIGVASIDPPLWPVWFSQSMTANFKDLNTTASYWYDSQLGAERYDFANGNTLTGCGCIHRMNTPCTHLITNGWLFMIFPQINLCCKLYEANPLPRTWLQNFTFKGEQIIDDIPFNVWDEGINEQFNDLFLTEIDDQQRPRRRYEGNKIVIDYWLNSFNSTRPKASLFDVPDYCQKRCSDKFESEEDYKRLLKELRKVHVGLSKEQRLQKLSLGGQ